MKGYSDNMKKYVITLVLILFCCIIIVLFSVPDRIQYALYGMSEYDLDDYNELRNDLPRCELVIDFSTYGTEPIMVYEYTEEVYLLYILLCLTWVKFFFEGRHNLFQGKLSGYMYRKQ